MTDKSSVELGAIGSLGVYFRPVSDCSATFTEHKHGNIGSTKLLMKFHILIRSLF